ncbi:MAG TPA: hypothetical protein VKT28_11955 [Puia sp.]|nr:hypothetical protein [Puia sp.]
MLTYTRFNSSEDSEYLVELLKKNNIPYELVHERNQLDNVYFGEALDQLYALKIPADQFNQLNQILADEAKIDFNKSGFAHYFSEFSKEELIDILNSPNDWNAYDKEIAKLCLEKNYQINDTAALNYVDSYTPENISLPWLIVGYLFSFSIVGLIAGSIVRTSKKTLANGKSVFMYNDSTRQHALIIFIIGIVGTVYYLIYGLPH